MATPNQFPNPSEEYPPNELRDELFNPTLYQDKTEEGVVSTQALERHAQKIVDRPSGS